jgi:microcompartment protein CcmK/EutM
MARRAKRNEETNIDYCLYCLVDGVYTKMVYQEKDFDGNYFYNELRVTPTKKASRLKSLTPSTSRKRLTETVTTTTQTPQGLKKTTTVNTITPKLILDYANSVDDTSGAVTSWGSSAGGHSFAQSLANNKPKLGVNSGGVNGYSAIFFQQDSVTTSNGDFLRISSGNVTLSGDFTIFINFNPNNLKYIRLLGNNANSDIGVYVDSANTISFGLDTGKVYNTTNEIEINKNALLTIQRNGTTLYVRKDGVQIDTATVATDDFVIDQIGRTGGSGFTLGGYIQHISAYDGYITTSLSEIEKQIIRTSSQATL